LGHSISIRVASRYSLSSIHRRNGFHESGKEKHRYRVRQLVIGYRYMGVIFPRPYLAGGFREVLEIGEAEGNKVECTVWCEVFYV
jgi:hypothetical protein